MSDHKPSDVERIKTASQQLRGSLAESLQNPLTGALAEDDTQLSKFHGIYQQDDRERRTERKRQKLEPAYSFMIRARLPGGVCSPEQWLAMDKLADEHANGSLRLTTRQAFQFHGVIKRNLKHTIAKINQSMLDTIAACGDVNRNVMCSPNPHASAAYAQAQLLAERISAHLTPQTGAYHEIWLDGEKVASTQEPVEPIYGKTYLPRKFKTGVVVPPQNDVDIYTQDLGFIAIVEDDHVVGYNLTVGGGMGSTHSDINTYPRLADTLGFCTADEALVLAEHVVTLQRDHGNRCDRKRARLKYTVDTMGVDVFREALEARAGVTLQMARDVVFETSGDRFGWDRSADGRWHFTAFIDSGRVVDAKARQLKTGLAKVAAVMDGEFRITPNQNIVIANVSATTQRIIDALLVKYGLREPTSVLQANAMACVALPTCGLAMAEAERYLPSLVSSVDALLAKHGLSEAPIALRMTGCPNGCARPFVAEIALVGKAPGRYNLYLGGAFNGTRLNKLHRENIRETEILNTLDSLFERYASERTNNEPFGDFCIRAGVIQATRAGRDFHDNTPLTAADA